MDWNKSRDVAAERGLKINDWNNSRDVTICENTGHSNYVVHQEQYSFPHHYIQLDMSQWIILQRSKLRKSLCPRNQVMPKNVTLTSEFKDAASLSALRNFTHQEKLETVKVYVDFNLILD
jgi:hypothetical protein